MLNTAIIMGRLTADPELKSTNNGIKVCAFTVAVERNAKAHKRMAGARNARQKPRKRKETEAHGPPTNEKIRGIIIVYTKWEGLSRG